MKKYVILATRQKSEIGPLYWSNDFGWVDRSSADVFDENETVTLSLPIGGVWVLANCESGHAPDWDTCRVADTQPASTVLDFWCSRCGVTGSVSVYTDDINWE
jgi:hypothetical protein